MTAPRRSPLFSRLWHGADYNYEQWLDYPEVLAEDFRLMRLAGCTAMSVGIFSWAVLEPVDGEYTFEWLDGLMDELDRNGIKAILATPSAAHPAWLSKQSPEVLRVDREGRRMPHRHRQNFCWTAPVFREKITAINTRLADRYKDHPALLLWHVSNEYPSTPCYCTTCLEGFRSWLKARYGDLDKLNHAWWATFWSHRFTDWEEIEPVDPSSNGMMLDWKRYNSDQALDFFLHEAAPLRRIAPDIPVTTNFMASDVGLDYWKFAEHVDLVSWDSYPEWHVGDDVQTAIKTAFFHDMHRGYKDGQPFYLIESSPSQTNWQPLSRLKRPGLLNLACAQALAHGAMGVNYFQWRQSRGGEEKFHGAVVGHRGGEGARVFKDVVEVGEMLAGLADLAAARTPARVALVYDYENEWALNLAYLPRKAFKEYQGVCIEHYANFWRMGIPIDLISGRGGLGGYALVLAPMLHLVAPETAARLAEFVRSGGTLVTTFLTGWVGESDLVHLGGYPAPLGEMLGTDMVEFDTFGAGQGVSIEPAPGNSLGLTETATAGRYAELLAPTSAEPLAVYGGEFYRGVPAVTANRYGAGTAYHLGAYTDEAFLAHFYHRLSTRLALEIGPVHDLPDGVTTRVREIDGKRYLFAMNFKSNSQTIHLEEGTWSPIAGGEPVGVVTLEGFGIKVFTNGSS
ncbi:MAG TPA: beta-galactosidase [Anaerolineales bacterium]|nr:beta-galactosidase [Anaerolineales bacterium]